MPTAHRLLLPALLAAATWLAACTTPVADPRSNPPGPSVAAASSAPSIDSPNSATTPDAPATTLTPFASEEGFARLARARYKANFAALANQFEAQYNGAFCGPTSAAIVLNTVHARTSALPRDHVRLRKEDVQFMPPGADPIVPRFTQDSVIDKGPKSRAQVLGEPVAINGKQVRDFGYQLRQFDAMLRGNGLASKAVVVDDARSEPSIRAELIEQVGRAGSYVLVNYRREAVGQRGGGHISPLAAYDQVSDSFLVLDVNPAVAGWVWMPTATLVRGMRTFDTVENRGYVLVSAP